MEPAPPLHQPQDLLTIQQCTRQILLEAIPYFIKARNLLYIKNWSASKVIFSKRTCLVGHNNPNELNIQEHRATSYSLNQTTCNEQHN